MQQRLRKQDRNHSETKAGSALQLVKQPCEEAASSAISRWSGSPLRRMFDFAAASCILLCFAPALLVIAVAVRRDSPGPAIFRQKRVGRYGTPFTIYKFRTMYTAMEGSGRSSHGDHRLTGPGRFLRHYKLDELPQLINVVKGDMSLVGPRPKLHDHHTLDHCVRPGLTGAATLAFASEEILLREIAPKDLERCHHELLTPRKLELDLAYMARATFRSDLRLMWRTLLRADRFTRLEELGGWQASASAEPVRAAAASDSGYPYLIAASQLDRLSPAPSSTL